MVNERVVVDGSNIATEGRTLPSLQQLDDAVRAFLAEFPASEATVVVDASFGHRIAEDEREAYEEAVLAGELVSPPAGAIGRGDAFVLSIANRADATVFSNDSFQEFHGQYTWLFDEGRLIGGKPVPGVGWVFVLRAPVRGPASRRSTRDAREPRATKATTKAKAATTSGRSRGRKSSAPTAVAVADADPVLEAVPWSDSSGRDEPAARGRRRRSTSASTAAVEPINEPLPFLQFVSAHPVGSVVEGTVDRFSSHGAYVVIGSAQCYLPLRSMADPPPKSAKEVLTVGETRSFVVDAFDPPRRSIDLAIPGLETAEATPVVAEVTGQPSPAEEAPQMAATKKAAAKRLAKKSPAKKATTKKAAARTLGKKSTAKKSAAKRSTAKKSTARKSTAKKSTTKKSTAKRAPAKKSTAKKSTAKRSTAKKSPAKKSTAKRAPAKRTTARKTTAKKS